MELGFIGIGRMGSRMAARLLAAGHRLAIHDRSTAACASLVRAGAVLARSAGEVAASADVVMTCLPGPKEVEEVMGGPAGILATARRNALLIEMSTIGPGLSRALAARAGDSGVTYIDAPISNGLEAAETGELTIMVGGEQAAYDRAVPILRHMGSRLYHLGPVGSGNFAKIANQAIYLSYAASFCEIARLGTEAGVDLLQFVDVMRHSVAGSPLMTHFEHRLENGDRKPGFAIERVLKDLQLAVDVAEARGVETPLLDEVVRAYRGQADAGRGDLDITALYSS